MYPYKNIKCKYSSTFLLSFYVSEFKVKVHNDHLRARQTFWHSGSFVETNLYYRFPGPSISCGKAAAVLLQAWSVPEGSRKLRFPNFMTTAQGGVVSLTHQPPLPPGNTPGTHFC